MGGCAANPSRAGHRGTGHLPGMAQETGRAVPLMTAAMLRKGCRKASARKAQPLLLQQQKGRAGLLQLEKQRAGAHSRPQQAPGLQGKVSPSCGFSLSAPARSSSPGRSHRHAWAVQRSREQCWHLPGAECAAWTRSILPERHQGDKRAVAVGHVTGGFCGEAKCIPKASV